MVDTRTLAREGGILPGYLHEIRDGDREIKDGQEALPYNKI